MTSKVNPNEEGPYFSCCSIKVAPGKIDEAMASFTDLADTVMKNEPGAKMYRYYKVEGKDEIACMEKFESREAYAVHVQSTHVRAWAEKYLHSGLFEGTFEFHHLRNNGEGAGGFDRP